MSPASQSHRNSEPRRGFTVTFVLCVLIAFVALSALVGGGVAVYGLACIVTGAYRISDLTAMVRRKQPGK